MCVCVCVRVHLCQFRVVNVTRLINMIGKQLGQRGEREFMTGDRVKCEPDIDAVRHNASGEEELTNLVTLV